jgi:hypothetical protein
VVQDGCQKCIQRIDTFRIAAWLALAESVPLHLKNAAHLF